MPNLLAKQTLEGFKPGESRKEHFKKLGKKKQFVGLFAEFSRYKGSQYKVIIPVTRNNLLANKIKVNISGNSMTLVK